jgi:23S rRNA (adenine2503-C2)-methyltransferase
MASPDSPLSTDSHSEAESAANARDAALPALSGMLPDELTEACRLERSYRGRQLFRWISHGVRGFDEMSDLPEELRARLAADFTVVSATVAERLADRDGTVKLVLTLRDGATVECVSLSDADERKTACLSTQVGCPLACAFCRTGMLGFARDLSASEIVDQFFALKAESGAVDNVVFMGMGEPLLNLRETRKAIAVLTHPDGLGFSPRRITVSTSGIAAGIRDLADNGPKVRLALSLVSGDQAVRESLMPVSKSNPLPELKEALAYFQSWTGDRVTLEIPLLGSINTGREAVEAIRRFSDTLKVNVNVIPWNAVPGIGFSEPSRTEIDAFLSMLAECGIPCTQRARRGRGVSGACGQLGALPKKNTAT